MKIVQLFKIFKSDLCLNFEYFRKGACYICDSHACLRQADRHTKVSGGFITV